MLGKFEVKPTLIQGLAKIDPLERLLYSSAIFISVLIRFVYLGTAPLPFADELVAAADIRDQLQTGHHFSGAPVILYDRLTTLIDGRLISGLVLGTSLLDMRLIAATFGVLSMAALVWLGLEIGSLSLGAIAACMYGLMPWAIYFNRVYIPASEYGFLSLIGSILLIRALKHHHIPSLYGAVLPLVVAIYLYPPALITSPGIATLFLFVYRKDITKQYLRHILGSGFLAVALLGYYAFVHFFPPVTAFSNVDATISSQELWQHQLSWASMLSRFVTDWASYLNPSFLLIHGDPTTQRQTIGVLGQVGYVIGSFGLLGIASAIRLRSREQRLLIAALLLYPVVDALTYWNANASSVVGFLGCIVWSVLAANGFLFLIRHGTKSVVGRSDTKAVGTRNKLLLTSFCFLALQMTFFSWYYLVRYPEVAASYFEIGLPQVVHILKDHNARRAPLVLQGSFAENIMLDYYDNNQPKVRGLYFNCTVLPYDAIHYTPPGVVIVVHESLAYNGTTGCAPGNQVIQLDISALKRAGRRFVLWGEFTNAPGSIYRTAVIFMEP